MPWRVCRGRRYFRRLDELPYLFRDEFFDEGLPLAGLACWYKADAITGLADGDPVAQWDDSSGNGRHLTQGTAANRPTYQTGEVNGLPVVRFDGSNDSLAAAAFTWNQPETVFLVFKYVAHAGGSRQILDGNAADALSFLVNSTVTQLYAGTALQLGEQTGVGAWAMVHLEVNGNSSSIRKNRGAATATGAAGGANAGGLWVGSSRLGLNYANVDVAEIVGYSGVLSTADRDAAESYLAAKYSL